MTANDTPRVRIVNTDGRGYMTKIYIDDVDVSACFRGVKLTAGTADGAIKAELEPVVVAVDVRGVEQLRMPQEGTKELLIRHGWTPPAEPVMVLSEVRRTYGKDYEPLAPGLFDPDETEVSGRDLLDRFLARLDAEWVPNDDDTLKVERVYDQRERPLAGRRQYTLTVTLDDPTATGPDAFGRPESPGVRCDGGAV